MFDPPVIRRAFLLCSTTVAPTLVADGRGRKPTVKRRAQPRDWMNPLTVWAHQTGATSPIHGRGIAPAVTGRFGGRCLHTVAEPAAGLSLFQRGPFAWRAALSSSIQRTIAKARSLFGPWRLSHLRLWCLPVYLSRRRPLALTKTWGGRSVVSIVRLRSGIDGRRRLRQTGGIHNCRYSRDTSADRVEPIGPGRRRRPVCFRTGEEGVSCR